MKSVLIMGGAGNMGRRYRAVLNSLGIKYEVWDISQPHWMAFDFLVKKSDGIIIATPTKSHFEDICNVTAISRKKPILCEKPICKDIAMLEKLLAAKPNVQMVNQYAHLIDEPPIKTDSTSYDYFHTGTDGLNWDCINIIGLDVTGDVALRNESPTWQCKINGWEINRGHMDAAYLDMVRAWANDPEPNLAYIEQAHKKAAAWKPSKTKY